MCWFSLCRQSVAASQGLYLSNVCTQHSLNEETLHRLYVEGLTSEAALAALIPEQVQALQLVEVQEKLLINTVTEVSSIR